jgi:hypothetical protein
MALHAYYKTPTEATIAEVYRAINAADFSPFYRRVHFQVWVSSRMVLELVPLNEAVRSVCS